ncbi:MAG: TIGR00296 family protein [Methanobrevibacter sp.]|jgi:uncharacterized protein (TIGR00296 family)|nr:TIGR00296 family protein [Methanobrevibacter sp.]
MLNEKDGEFLINLAKNAIKTYLKSGEVIFATENAKKDLKEKLGVFVTLNKNQQLKGCIGYPEPVYPLLDTVIKTAISAATDDPRFNKLSIDEFEEVEVEVSVLTKPEILRVNNPKDYPNEIVIGRDGLIIELGYNRGLLLPQVAPENDMNSETFLSQTCLKAGLNYECWLNNEVTVYTFQGQIFKEENYKNK